jgi:hypothetical protein
MSADDLTDRINQAREDLQEAKNQVNEIRNQAQDGGGQTPNMDKIYGDKPPVTGHETTYAYAEKAHDGIYYEAGAGVYTARGAAGEFDVLTAEAKAGLGGGSNYYGVGADAGVLRVNGSLPEILKPLLPIVPEILQEDAEKLLDSRAERIEAPVLNARANVSANEDGAIVGAAARVAEVAVTTGTSDAASDTDETTRVKVALGSGLEFRGHWNDADEDGYREYGVGAKMGPVSIDVTSEDPLRTLLENPLPLPNMPSIIIPPEENLTESVTDLFGLSMGR